jgi:hypothetical protein
MLAESITGVGSALHRIRLVDGEVVCWFGSRAVQGLAYLPNLRLAQARITEI